MIFMGNAEVMRRNDERRICELKFSWDWQLRLQDACPVPLNSNYRYSILNGIESMGMWALPPGFVPKARQDRCRYLHKKLPTTSNFAKFVEN